MTTKVLFAASLLVLSISLARAQALSPKPTPDCAAPIYGGKEVSKKAKITFYPPPEPPKDKRAQGVTGTVVLHVVLCRSGQVTDIDPVRKLPYGMTESAIDAAKRVRFIPAEKDGQNGFTACYLRVPLRRRRSMTITCLRTPNESLDASGGSVFRKIIGPAMVHEFAPPRQLNRSLGGLHCFENPRGEILDTTGSLLLGVHGSDLFP